MLNNRRHFPRRKTRIETKLLFHDDEPRTIITHDMSESGMLLQIKDTNHYPLGELVGIQFKNPFQDFEDTVRDAVVVRHANNGLAIAFVDIEIA